jgi:hypothetical protein
LHEPKKDRNQTELNHGLVHQVAICTTGFWQFSCQSFVLKNIIELKKTGL